MKKIFLLVIFFLCSSTTVEASTYIQVTTTASTSPTSFLLNGDSFGTNPVGTYRTMTTYGAIATTSDNVFLWNKLGGGCSGSGCTIANPYPIVVMSPVPGARYWQAIYISGIDTVFYGYADFDEEENAFVGSEPPVFTSSSETLTRFTDLNISGTSTVDIIPEYFISSDEVFPTNARFNPSHVRITKSLRPASSTSVESVSITPWVLDTYATTSLSFTGLSDGVYDILITFGNLSSVLTGVLPFANAYVYSEFTVSGGILTATGTVEIYNGYSGPDTPDEYLYQECGITAISGCINNSLVFLFQPNQEFLNDSYERLNEAKRTNAPFSHIEDLKNVFVYLNQEFQGSTTPPTVKLTVFGNTDIYMMSSSSFAMVDDDTYDSFRALQIAFLWVALGFALWSTRHQLTL